MNRTVTASLEVNVPSPARLAFQMAVADPEGYRAEETITMTLDGDEGHWRQLDAPHGGRIWLVDAGRGARPALLTSPGRAVATAMGAWLR
jgi:hypothetical protein